MGSFANTLFTILLGWLRGAVSAVWTAFTSEKGNSFLNWIGDHWILLAVILCVIGLAADLCVYLLRWKPFMVWKSFLSRGRDTEEDTEEPEEKPVLTRKTPERPQRVFAPVPPARKETRKEPDFSQWEAEEENPVRPAETAGQPATVTGAGYTVPADSPYRRPAAREYNPAGRTQNPREERTPRRAAEPAEREYRRPAEADERVYRRPADDYSLPEEQPVSRSRRAQAQDSVIRTPVSREYIAQEDYPETERPQEDAAPVVFRRRRRISVSDLFSDPEEELKQIDAPQDIIDMNRAYRQPVYPRGWKQNEDHEE